MSTTFRACYWTDGRGEVRLTSPEHAHLLEWEDMPDEWKEWAARSLERQRNIRNEREGAVRERRLESGQWEKRALSQAAEGEDIMVNTPYDVFILPLQPSGLSSGPRFVVHVPGPAHHPQGEDHERD